MGQVYRSHWEYVTRPNVESELDYYKSLTRTNSAQALYAGDILYILVLYITKCSAALFYLRISPRRSLFRAVVTVIGLSTAWAIGSAMIVAIRCHPDKSWFDIVTRCEQLVGNPAS